MKKQIFRGPPVDKPHTCIPWFPLPLLPLTSVISPQHRSSYPYTPKISAGLSLVLDILKRHEQVAIGAAFHDPLNLLSRYLTQASVPHLHLDGRINPRARGKLSLQFQQGQIPVALAGVQSMANGHNWYRCRNIILLAYDWAYDVFEQFINRAYRLTSPQDVNLYCLIANGTTDRKLEQNIGEKSDASELVLDGRLLTAPPQEVNLAELLQIARHQWSDALSSISSAKEDLIDESILAQEWPALRVQLAQAASAWNPQAQAEKVSSQKSVVKPATTVLRSLTSTLRPLPSSPLSSVASAKERPVLRSPATAGRRRIPLWQLRLYRLL